MSATSPLATVTELQQGWRVLSAFEQGIASALLSRASSMVGDALASAGVDYDDLSDDRKANAKTVVCDMARYAMVTGSMGQTGFMGDAVSASVAPGDMEGGSLILTRKHRSMLGIGGQAGFAGCDHGEE